MSGSPNGHLVVADRHAFRAVKQFGLIVDALALEEDDRIGARQGGVHQALGVVGRGGKGDFQAGNMRAERGPVLASAARRTCCPPRRA